MRKKGNFSRSEKEALLSFFAVLRSVKFTPRKGWQERGVEADSIAGHSFDTIHVGWFLAKLEGVDEVKVIKMAAIHDLVMAYMEDVTPNSGRYEQKARLEERAFDFLKKDLPTVLQEEFIALWEEFKGQATKEAVVTREADKLATLLQGDAYEEETGRDIHGQNLQYYQKVFKTNWGKRFYRFLLKRHQERRVE